MYLSSPTVILLINALFGTNYPQDSTIEYLSTENITDTLNQWISDMVLLINHTDKYHMEVQIADDEDMGLRVFNYDYLEALKTKTVEDTTVNLLFAKSMVIYLESTALTPAELSVTLRFSDKSVHDFIVPTFKLLDYSITELEQRNMSVLLPLYLLKLRKRVTRAKSSKQRRELSVELKNLVEEIVLTIERSEQNGQMSKSDMRTLMGGWIERGIQQCHKQGGCRPGIFPGRHFVNNPKPKSRGLWLFRGLLYKIAPYSEPAAKR
jgi:hypothetical protein